MASWQEIGRRICDRHLNPHLRPEESGTCLGDEEALLGQVRQAIDETMSLIDYLLRKVELHPSILIERAKSSTDRNRLAQDLRDILYRQPERGPPRNDKLRIAACLAVAIYRECKAENISAGINDRGLGRQMKDQSSAFALEILDTLFDGWQPARRLDTLLGGPPPARESVREMMDRSIRRRK
jgi:hypothetical protein